MKIVHVIDFYGPQGGAHFFLERMFRVLKDTKYDQEVVALEETPYQPEQAAYQYTIVPEERLCKYFTEKKPDFIQVHCTVSVNLLKEIKGRFDFLVTLYDNMLFCPYLFFKDNIRCEKQFSHTCVECGCLTEETFKRQIQLIESYRELDCIGCMCSGISQRLIEYGFYEDRIHKLPTLLEKQEGKKTKEKCMLFYGRLCEKKGVDQLVEALAQVELGDWRVVFIGTGDAVFVRKMFKICAKNKLIKKVLFPGQLPEEQVNIWFQKAQVFLAPYVGDEGYANGVEKAMSYGLPIVGYDICGIEDWCKNGENGIIAKPNDVNKLTQNIEHIIKESEILNNTRKYAIDKMNKMVLLEHQVHLLKCIIEKRGKK